MIFTLDELLNSISKKDENTQKADTSAPEKAETTETTEKTEGTGETQTTEKTEGTETSEDGMPMSDEFMSFCETRKE